MQNNPPNPSKLSCMIAVCHRQPVYVPEEYMKLLHDANEGIEYAIF